MERRPLTYLYCRELRAADPIAAEKNERSLKKIQLRARFWEAVCCRLIDGFGR